MDKVTETTIGQLRHSWCYPNNIWKYTTAILSTSGLISLLKNAQTMGMEKLKVLYYSTDSPQTQPKLDLEHTKNVTKKMKINLGGRSGPPSPDLKHLCPDLASMLLLPILGRTKRGTECSFTGDIEIRIFFLERRSCIHLSGPAAAREGVVLATSPGQLLRVRVWCSRCDPPPARVWCRPS